MSTETPRSFEFGEFSLDPVERKLARNGFLLQLTDKPFEVLLTLVENPGHLLDKDELMRRIWPDTFVEEGTLARNIARIRQVLGETNQDRKYIEVVPKRGYRFIAPVRRVEKQADCEPAYSFPCEVAPAIPLQSEQTGVEGTSSWEAPLCSVKRGRGRWYVLTAVCAAIVVAVLYFGIRRQPKAASPGVPDSSSLAIVPSNHTNPAAARSKPSARKLTHDPLAYEAYLKGRYFWGKRVYAGYQKSLAYFQEAIDRDPRFALAYAGLADANAMGGDWIKAEPLAKHALELDDSIGEAHASLGFVKMFWQWNWTEADAELRKAIDLSPDYATGHQWYGLSLAIHGRLDEAESELKRARQIDPLSPAIGTDLAQILYYEGKYDEAAAQCNRVIEIDPDFLFAHLQLARIYDQQGMYDEEIEQVVISSNYYASQTPQGEQHIREANAFRRAYLLGGIRGYRLRLLEEFKKGGGYYGAAALCARLGDFRKALAYLSMAYSARDFQMAFVGVDPVFSGLHSDKSFQDIRRRVGLPARESREN